MNVVVDVVAIHQSPDEIVFQTSFGNDGIAAAEPESFIALQVLNQDLLRDRLLVYGIVVKVGSGVLSGGGEGLCAPVLKRLAMDIAKLRADGVIN